jgi:hypothetical protein
MASTPAARPARPANAHSLLIGETVHYRAAGRCWAAAIVEPGADDSAQLYLFPLPPAYAMPQAPGTFVMHDGGTAEASWHRFAECVDAPKSAGRGRAGRGTARRTKRRSPTAEGQGES